MAKHTRLFDRVPVNHQSAVEFGPLPHRVERGMDRTVLPTVRIYVCMYVQDLVLGACAMTDVSIFFSHNHACPIKRWTQNMVAKSNTHSKLDGLKPSDMVYAILFHHIKNLSHTLIPAVVCVNPGHSSIRCLVPLLNHFTKLVQHNFALLSHAPLL